MPVDGKAVGCVVGDAVGYCDFQLIARSSFYGWAGKLAFQNKLILSFFFLLCLLGKMSEYVPFMRYMSLSTPSGRCASFVTFHCKLMVFG